MAEVKLLAGERQEGESSRAIQACNDYLRMGSGRSLPKLWNKYTKTHKNAPPTDSLDTLKKWSTDYFWQERAVTYDAELDQQRTERRRKEIETGLAQDFERVRKLKRLAKFLEEQIFEELRTTADEGEELPEGSSYSTLMRSNAFRFGNVWLPDVKQIGSGEDAKRVDIVRFNAAILEQFRGVLDDLARETGGRKQKTDHSGLIASIDLSKLSTEQVERIAAGEDVMQVILSGYIQRVANSSESGT